MNPDQRQATEQVRGLFYGTPYRLIRPLGEGGMGAVFLVEHVDLGRQCVAKVLHARLAGDANLIDRMRIEAQSLGRLHHPNIVQITGFGTTHDARPFLVMEWLRGHTLSDELEVRGQLPAREALELAAQMLAALSAAHAVGLVHRDIKPENLFLCEEPTGDRRLKVLDFGMARVLPDAPEGAPDPLVVPTGTGMVVGTPRYVSPEGAMGKRVDARADIYGAGLVLYNMLAGRGPFDHLHGDALLGAHALRQPEPPSHYAKARLPPSLDLAVQKALSKNPEHRFQSALDFRAELERIAAEAFRAPAAFEITAPHAEPAPVPITLPAAVSEPAPAAPPPPSSRLTPGSRPATTARAPAATAPPHIGRVIAIAALTALVVALLVGLAVTALFRGFK